jgi:hypothetical protein
VKCISILIVIIANKSPCGGESSEDVFEDVSFLINILTIFLLWLFYVFSAGH